MYIAFGVLRALKLKMCRISGLLLLAALSVFALGMVPNLFQRLDLTLPWFESGHFLYMVQRFEICIQHYDYRPAPRSGRT